MCDAVLIIHENTADPFPYRSNKTVSQMRAIAVVELPYSGFKISNGRRGIQYGLLTNMAISQVSPANRQVA